MTTADPAIEKLHRPTCKRCRKGFAPKAETLCAECRWGKVLAVFPGARPCTTCGLGFAVEAFGGVCSVCDWWTALPENQPDEATA